MEGRQTRGGGVFESSFQLWLLSFEKKKREGCLLVRRLKSALRQERQRNAENRRNELVYFFLQKKKMTEKTLQLDVNTELIDVDAVERRNLVTVQAVADKVSVKVQRLIESALLADDDGKREPLQVAAFDQAERHLVSTITGALTMYVSMGKENVFGLRQAWDMLKDHLPDVNDEETVEDYIFGAQTT